jgi:hypothetical protein
MSGGIEGFALLVAWAQATNEATVALGKASAIHAHRANFDRANLARTRWTSLSSTWRRMSTRAA